MKGADNARNYSQCDSLLLGDKCGAHTFPYIDVQNSTAQMEHEASTSKIGEDQVFYFQQRGISAEDAVNMIVNGFCKEVFKELPMEFAVEAQKLLGVSASKAASGRAGVLSRGPALAGVAAAVLTLAALTALALRPIEIAPGSAAWGRIVRGPTADGILYPGAPAIIALPDLPRARTREVVIDGLSLGDAPRC